MTKLLSALWAFLTFQLLAGFLFYQHDYENDAFTLFFKHKSSAPLLLLQVGMVIFIVSLGLYYLHVMKMSDTDTKYPILFTDNVQSELKKFWEVLTFVAIVFVPWIGFIWMWVAFHDTAQSVWQNHVPENTANIYDRVSSPFSFYCEWNNYKYGRAPDGDSFVPFWQPILIMWPLTIVAFSLTTLITYKILNLSLIHI